MNKTVRIYKIFSTENPSRVYIGSTCRKLTYRLYEHKKCFFTFSTFGVAPATSRAFQLFKEYGADTAQIEELESFTYQTDEQRKQREQYHIDNHSNVVNKNKTYLGNEEQRKEYKRTYIREYMRKYAPKYYQQHKEDHAKKYQWTKECRRLRSIDV